MYIRGELSNPSTMLVEIGTGYFAEVSKEKAVEFFERKKKYISTQVRLFFINLGLIYIYIIFKLRSITLFRFSWKPLKK